MTPLVPEVVTPRGAADYLEVMTRAVFQTGLRWKQIAGHWASYRQAFCDFDAVRVAAFSDPDVARVLETPGVLRSERKIRATIRNAQALLAIEREHGSLDRYLRGLEYAALSRELRTRFAFMGEMNAWYFAFRVGLPVPRFEGWVQTIPGDHPRMREMVDLARKQGRSSERP
ncbi:MAG: DNA-3-methyladenine glycosylase I [Candidatus Tyrphobacter sp.]